MMFLILGIGAFFLPILLHLAIRLRLGIPMLYAVMALTVFHGWYQANPAFGDAIFFGLVGLAALSWVVTAAWKICDAFDEWRADRAAAQQFAEMHFVFGRPGPQANMPLALRACGVDFISLL